MSQLYFFLFINEILYHSCEASGDLYGSNLIKEILKLDDNAEIRAWGGDLMERAGANCETLQKP